MFSKTLFIAAAASLATVVMGDACPSTELTKLVPIASNSNVAQCTTDSGYTLIPPPGLPTSEELAKMCVSTACKNLIQAVKDINPSDCDLTIGSVTLNVYSLVNTFDSDCAALTTTTPTSTTATPATTTATPATTTATPATTTATPANTTATPTPANSTDTNSC